METDRRRLRVDSASSRTGTGRRQPAMARYIHAEISFRSKKNTSRICRKLVKHERYYFKLNYRRPRD